MNRAQSAFMRKEYEALDNLFESLNKKCVFSGLLPTLHTQSEILGVQIIGSKTFVLPVVMAT